MDRKKIYKTYENEKLILRDCLAADRTLLANERTYLAYLRTVVGLLAAGIGLIKYINDGILIQILGWVCVISSVITFYFGTKRFLNTRKPIKDIFK